MVAGRGGFFYGWIVVGAAFMVMFVGFGAAYSFASFFASLEAEFGATRGDISLVFSIAGFLYFGLGAVSGLLADRFGPRIVCLAGMLITGAGLLLAAVAVELWQVYLGYGLGVGVGVGFAYVPAIGAVQHWFTAKRGLASGIAVSGIGVGTLVVPSVAAELISWAGWRDAYMLLAFGPLVIGTIAAWLIHGRPADRGLAPDGGPSLTAAKAAAPVYGLTLAEASRTRPFWIFFFAFVILSVGIFIPFVHMVPYAIDHGLSVEDGAALIGLIGVGSTLGRFLLGGFADRFGRRLTMAALFAGMGACFFIWLGSEGFLGLGIFAALFGACYGGFVALAPAVAADYFGARAVSSILGVLYAGVAFGTLIGPPFAGYVFDWMASYTLPILLSVAVSAIATAMIALMPDAARWRAEREAAAIEAAGRAGR